METVKRTNRELAEGNIRAREDGRVSYDSVRAEALVLYLKLLHREPELSSAILSSRYYLPGNDFVDVRARELAHRERQENYSSYSPASEAGAPSSSGSRLASIRMPR